MPVGSGLRARRFWEKLLDAGACGAVPESPGVGGEGGKDRHRGTRVERLWEEEAYAAPGGLLGASSRASRCSEAESRPPVPPAASHGGGCGRRAAGSSVRGCAAPSPRGRAQPAL